MTLDFESDKKSSGSGSTLGGYLFFPRKFSPSKKSNEVGGGYLGLECAAALVGWGV